MTQAYPAYKDSGVEWLGEVPEGWGVRALKGPFNIFGGTTPKSDIEGYWDGNVTWVTPADLSNLPSKFIAGSQRQISESGLSSCGTTLVPAGALVLSIRAPIGSLAIAAVELCTNQGCKSLVSRGGAEPGFFYYALLAAKESLNVLGRGSTFLELSADQLAAFRVPLPPLAEQRAIAAFLDQETAKIDALVAEQRRLIDLLREKRQAVISHAVTRGLNPTASLKPSGIDWLGDVPEGWEVCGIKFYCVRITDGAHISPDTENGAFPFVSTKDVSEDGIDFENCLQTSDTTYRYMVATGCQPVRCDILFSKDGTIGRTAMVTTDVEFVVASSLIIIRPDQEKCSTDFVNYLCQSSVVSSQVASFVKGAGLPRLSISNLLKVIGVFPSREEQVAIASGLDKATAKLDTLTATAETAITLLQERRAALISAAVTGKIDVRDLAEMKTEDA